MAKQPAPEPAAAGRSPLSEALLDYHRHPGKYSTALREPAVLFGSIRAILQLAAGKSADDEHGASVQRAAAFFVRFAVIFPGADHYTLLGVTRASDAATIKEHYRLMMRLVHPDFSGGPGSSWPSDAATRINLAYEVLRTPEKRAQYEESLPVPAVATRPTPSAGAPATTPPKPATPEPRVLVKQLAAGFGALGAMGVLALVVASNSEHESESLIQMERPSKASAAQEQLVVQSSPPAQPASSPPATSSIQIAVPPSSPISPPALHSRAFAPPQAPTRQPAPPATAPAAALIPSIVATASAPPVVVAPPPAVAAPALVPVAVTVPAPPPPPAPVAAQAPATAPAAEVTPKPNASVTLTQAQPLLAMLLQQLESGRGERLLNLLERDARNAPAARALARQFDGLVAGAHPVKLAKVEFRAEPGDGRLFVVGHVRLHTGDASAAKPLALRIEFMSREGTVVMTGLSALAEN